jgi:hypothetical protein
MTVVDLGELGLDEGAQLLVKRALRSSDRVRVIGTSPTLAIDLPAWCRARGHGFADGVIVRGDAAAGRLFGAERAGAIDRAVDDPPQRWGLAARGSLVEAGARVLEFTLSH